MSRRPPVNRSQEVESIRTMIDRTKWRHDLKPCRLVGDTAYVTAMMLGWIVRREIAPHVPVWSKNPREDGTFSISEFA
jgi:hypothetical protein